MEALRKKYIIDENQKKIAVQIDINDFERIERVIEDYGLGKLIEQNDPTDSLSPHDATLAYQKLKKAK